MSDDDDEKRLPQILFELKAEQKRNEQQRPLAVGAENVSLLDDERRSRYAQRALAAELASIEGAPVGKRNDALNRAAFSLGQLVAANALDESETRAALRSAALRAGLTESETPKSIESGMSKGKQNPRELTSTQLVSSNDTSSADAPFGTVSGSSSQPPPVEPPSADELADFWSSRPLLTHVQQYARARIVSPWAVLGCVLARIVAATPATVVLPSIIGSHASLNLFVGLVGPSGAGKGAAERVAAECLRLGKTLTILTTGSGEGIAHGYVKRLRDGTIDPHTESVLYTVPEIDTLAALGSRQGSTLMPELRRAWSGEQLGFQYVDPAKRLTVEAHSYRMTLIAGIQPARSAALLDDSDGGTPQRFIWADAIDRDAPDVEPECPQPMTWREPAWTAQTTRDVFGTGKNEMHVCELAQQTIREARRARNRSDADALDGHALLARLKTAAALSIADGRCDVTEDDWALAAVVMKQSDATRALCAQALAGAARERNVGKALADADRSQIINDREHDAALRRACRAILRKLHSVDEHRASRNTLRKAVQYRDRGQYDEACSTLASTGQIEADLDAPSESWKLV